MLKKIFQKCTQFFHAPVPNGFYEEYWRNSRGSYGARFVPMVCDSFEFNTVLDAGSGEGSVVREFLKHGKDAKGIELSNAAVANCADLVASARVKQGSLQSLPYTDASFDLIFSSEVLEHIPESDIPAVVAELCRVARHRMFFTISLRPSSNNNAYHSTLKPRKWWEEQFIGRGWHVSEAFVQKFQRRIPGATTREILEAGPTLSHIDEMDWFIDGNVVDFNGELEPWFFVFHKD